MTLNIAMLSFWHPHARDYANQLAPRTDCRIVAVWDEDAERGRQEAERLSVPFYGDLQQLLQLPELDAVVVDAPSGMHPEVIVAAAKAGKHVFSEKVLAITTRECDEILAAVEQSGVKFILSTPFLSLGHVLYAKQALDQNLLGRITLARLRIGHDACVPKPGQPDGWLSPTLYDKRQSGGGAMIDLGCHPMYIAYHLLGFPEAVTAQYTHVTGHEIEDNAVSLLRYEDGALAVVESSLTAPFSDSLELYGTEGTLICANQVRLRSKKLGDYWITPDPLPKQLRWPIEQWVDYILYDTEPHVTGMNALARALTRLMEASNLSAVEARTVTLND